MAGSKVIRPACANFKPVSSLLLRRRRDDSDDGSQYDDDDDQEVPFVCLVDDDDDDLYSPAGSFSLTPAVSAGGKLHHELGTNIKDSRSAERPPPGNYPNSQFLSPDHRQIKLAAQQAVKGGRTPRTVMRMMEKHRENERVRHHTLNESMKNLCRKVPGYEEHSKETKVVMMQRVICYITYLEKMIDKLCDELSISLDVSNTFLTARLKKKQDSKRNFHECPEEHFNNRKSRYLTSSSVQPEIPKIVKDRQEKISSPTVDSTTDDFAAMLNVNNRPLQESDNAVFSGLPFTDEGNFLESAISWLNNDEEDSTVVSVTDEGSSEPLFSVNDNGSFGVVSSSLDQDAPSENSQESSDNQCKIVPDVPVSMELISPCKKLKADHEDSRINFSNLLQDETECGLGIRSDLSQRDKDFDQTDTPSELKSISPERVLPTYVNNWNKISLGGVLSSGRSFLTEHEKHSVSLKSLYQNKKENKYAVENLKGASSHFGLKRHLRGAVGKKNDDQFVCYMSNFHEQAVTRRQKAEVARLQDEFGTQLGMKLESEKNGEKKGKPEKPPKVDHRKTSWMNGFMMFSRLNRRKFINANPGVHTSHISKMMGHAWRSMPEEEQHPYKEKAKQYAKYMQDAFNLQMPAQTLSSSTLNKESIYSSSTVDNNFPLSFF